MLTTLGLPSVKKWLLKLGDTYLNAFM